MDTRRHTLILILLAAAATLPAARSAGLGERLGGLFGSPDDTSRTFLPADEAFQFAASVTGPRRLNLMWQIADGYYLYHDRFTFSIVKGGASLGQEPVSIPAGTVEHDPNFGSVEINTGNLSVDIPVNRTGTGKVPIVLRVGYQGCKQNEICYPPVTREVALTLPPPGAAD